MSIQDVLTSDLITRVSAVSLTDMVLGFVFSFLLGMFIFYVYKKSFNGVLYSANFGLSLVGMCMISTILIMAVSSNVVLSLGMVGALSIVRFRTAIKEPMDIVFLFWAISAGIIVATGMIPLAVLGSLTVGAVIMVFANRSGRDNPYLIIISLTDSGSEEAVLSAIEKACERSVLKSKSYERSGQAELTVEVQLKGGESAFVRELAKMEGVISLSMVSYNGDYMS